MYKFGEIIVNVRANKANFGPTKIRPFWDWNESVGDGIADGFSKKLLKQANTGGVSVTNISRG